MTVVGFDMACKLNGYKTWDARANTGNMGKLFEISLGMRRFELAWYFIMVSKYLKRLVKCRRNARSNCVACWDEVHGYEIHHEKYGHRAGCFVILCSLVVSSAAMARWECGFYAFIHLKGLIINDSRAEILRRLSFRYMRMWGRLICLIKWELWLYQKDCGRRCKLYLGSRGVRL